MDQKLIITYDPEADTIYVAVADPSASIGETLVDDSGTIIDTDREGNPRGFEFLDVSAHGVSSAELPPDVASALASFIASGALTSKIAVQLEVPS
jgi:uncharacterized protein YuzE